MKSKVLYLVALLTVLTAVFAGSAGAANDGYIFFNGYADGQISSSTVQGEGLYRIGCDGSDPEVLLAPGTGPSFSYQTMAAVGTTLYYMDNSTLKKIVNATTATTGSVTPAPVTVTGSPALSSSMGLVNNSGELYSFTVRYTGGSPLYAGNVQRITGLSGSPTATTYAVTPAVSGWSGDSSTGAGIAIAGTTPTMFFRPARNSSTSTTFGMEQTSSFQADMTLAATTATGAPGNPNSRYIASDGTNVYTEGDYTWIARFNADTSTWTSQWGKLFHNPTGSNAGDANYGTRNLFVNALGASTGGVYTVAGYGQGGEDLLAGYSVQSGGFAYISHIDDAFSQAYGGTWSFDYIHAVAVAGTCTFDPATVRPSIKSFAAGDKPTYSSSQAVIGTAVSVTSPGNWTEGSSANTYQYQWQFAPQNCFGSPVFADISGETNAAYTPTSSNANGCVRVKITGVNASGVVGFPVYSEKMLVQQSGGGGGGGGGSSPYVNVVAPTVTQSGCTYTLSDGTWTPTPVTYDYRWFRLTSGSPPVSVGTSRSLTVTAADTGNSYQAMVMASGPAASTGYATRIVRVTSDCTSGASATSTSADSTPSTPTVGPALRVTSIPKEITLEIAAPSADSPTQEITAEVPCEAPEGALLDRCTVNMTAPAAVMLGQGDGISVRADKVVSIGRATVKAKSGKKVIVVKVKVNQRGRKALRINTKITATIGLTAVTVSNQESTGSTKSEMQLPTQLLSPQAGIFEAYSTTLNKAGVQFVNRLAQLLPKSPKKMVFIGFADNTGVPGDNRWLGDRRAKAVRAALEAKGIVAVKSEIESKAARSPRDDNSKESGRERNRRVSIRITY